MAVSSNTELWLKIQRGQDKPLKTSSSITDRHRGRAANPKWPEHGHVQPHSLLSFTLKEGRIPLSAAKPPEQRLFNVPSASDKQTHSSVSAGTILCYVVTKGMPKMSPHYHYQRYWELLINYNQLFSAVGSSEGSEEVRLKHNEQRGIHPGLPWKSSRVASRLGLTKSHVSSCFSQAIFVSDRLGRADRGSFVPRLSASVFVSVTSAGETSTDKTMWTEARSNQNTAKEPRGERRGWNDGVFRGMWFTNI